MLPFDSVLLGESAVGSDGFGNGETSDNRYQDEAWFEQTHPVMEKR